MAHEQQAPRVGDSADLVILVTLERKQSRPLSNDRRVREHPPRKNRDLAFEGTASLRPCFYRPSRLVSKHAHDLNTMPI